MRCAKCGCENDEGSKFCLECAAPLLSCARCGHPNPTRAKFCAECGAPLVSTAAKEGERRQLTVMFCDLVGSTALSARLDPEILRDVIRDYQVACAEVVKRFDGSIVQYLGDGILVYFGVPHAHEDDARRAGCAGLDIVRAMGAVNTQWASKIGVQLAVRVGIHTGPVVVGEMGGGHKTEQLAIGETPNIAARLQSCAKPNAIVASHITHRLLSAFFNCRDLGEIPLSGVQRPIRVYELLEESSLNPCIQSLPGMEPVALVGRRKELAVLLESWGQAREGQRRVNLLSGEAGIGKSRLVQMLREHVESEGGTILEARCSPYYQNTAFYAVTLLLARWFGFQSSDPPADRRRKLEATLGTLSIADPAALQLLSTLLSLPVDLDDPVLQLDATRRRQRTLEVLLELPRCLAVHRPMALIMEDLHWVDPSTQEFLSRCVELPEPCRMLIILTCRPEFDGGWRTKGGVMLLELGGLDVPHAEELVVLAARGKTLPPEVVREIVRRAGGVPMFIEEITRAVVESGELQDAGDRYELAGGLSSPSVPMTLQDALMARLDRLGGVKSLVQLGATIGHDFSYGLLQAVSGIDHSLLQQQLGIALQSGLLQAHGTLPDASLVFKHALVRDTAYQSLLRKTQQVQHQRIATVLEDRFREIAEQRPELLAHHHTEAGNLAKAVPYWQRAGEHGIGRAAFAEAIAHITRGLRLLEKLPESAERDRQELALQSPLGLALQATRGYAAPEVDLAYRRARDLCRRVGGPAEFLSVSRGQMLFYGVRGESTTAMELGAELLKLGAETGSAEYVVEGHLTVGLALNYFGRFAESRSHLEQGLAIHNPHDRHLASFHYVGHSATFCHSYLGRVLSILGYHDQALRSSEQGLAQARALSIPLSQAQAMGMLTLLHQTRRDFEAAQFWADKTIAYASEYGFAYWSAVTAMVRGWVIAHRGQLDEGITRLQQGLDRYGATGAKLGVSWLLALVAELYAKSHQWEFGLQAVAQGLAHASATGERYYEAELHRVHGELLVGQLGPGAGEAAEASFRRALEVARNQSARTWELRAAASLSRLWRDQDRRADARELLGGIYEWFTEGPDISDLRDARQLLDELGGHTPAA